MSVTVCSDAFVLSFCCLFLGGLVSDGGFFQFLIITFILLQNNCILDTQ